MSQNWKTFAKASTTQQEAEADRKMNPLPFAFLMGAATATLFFMVPTVIDTFREHQEALSPPSRFEVVDQYKGCSVVRYAQSNMAEYKYFLHCPNI